MSQNEKTESYCGYVKCYSRPTHKITGFATDGMDEGYVHILVCESCYKKLMHLCELEVNDEIIYDVCGLEYIESFDGEIENEHSAKISL